jgi:hypothetical protein
LESFFHWKLDHPNPVGVGWSVPRVYVTFFLCQVGLSYFSCRRFYEGAQSQAHWVNFNSQPIFSLSFNSIFPSLYSFGILRRTFRHEAFFAQQDETSKQLAGSGYVFGAHAKEDAIREKDKRIPKMKRMYSSAVRLWMEWVLLSSRIACRLRCRLTLSFVNKYVIKGYESGLGYVTIDYMLLKEFFRRYGYAARGKKSKDGRPVMTPCLADLKKCCKSKLWWKTGARYIM